mmetsp:Transcript_75779/g.202891  ORF Transcript_75779/g.202891 Transcript_75779/m.202891 type:complete len:232 (+) Transcript_75779:560-1255(+)
MSVKRKRVSEAERIATDISKMLCGSVQPTRFTLDNQRLVFLESSGIEFKDRCCWKEDRANPRYCKSACLKFDSCLPDRKFLIRYTAQCSTCYHSNETAHHLFCAYCNEILTGYIAGPGGKISDHLITIRHMYNEAIALKTYVRNNISTNQKSSVEVNLVREYLSRLEEWVQTIRFPSKCPVKRDQFEDLIQEISADISQIPSKVSGFSTLVIGRLSNLADFHYLFSMITTN